LVCPHAAIRAKAYPEADLAGAPEAFVSRKYTGKDLPDHLFTIQVAPDDCTGCSVCVDVCPAKSKEEVKHTIPNSSIEKRTAHRSSASSSGLQNYLQNPNSIPSSIVSGGGIGMRAFGKDLSNLNYP
jgi:NAD-dependent dihydropyrimidine dehydrogenase PreA subunit